MMVPFNKVRDVIPAALNGRGQQGIPLTDFQFRFPHLLRVQSAQFQLPVKHFSSTAQGAYGLRLAFDVKQKKLIAFQRIMKNGVLQGGEVTAG